MTVHSVDEWLWALRSTPVLRFYPTSAAKATGLPPREALERLMALRHIGWVRLAYEIRCSCGSTLDVVETDDPSLLYGRRIPCEWCGLGEDEQEVTAEHIFPVFIISEEWRASAKKAAPAAGVVAPAGSGDSLWRLASMTGLGLADLIAPREAAQLRDLLSQAPEDPESQKIIEQVLIVLQSMPRNVDERRAWYNTMREVGEAVKVWTEVIKNLWPFALILAPYYLSLLAKISR